MPHEFTSSAKFESNPYSNAVLELIKVFFRTPFLIILTFSETSPRELKGAVDFLSNDSSKENLSDNFTLSFLILSKELDPFLNEDSLTPFQLSISTKSATACGSNHTLYFPGLSSIFGLFISFSLSDAS